MHVPLTTNAAEPILHQSSIIENTGKAAAPGPLQYCAQSRQPSPFLSAPSPPPPCSPPQWLRAPKRLGPILHAGVLHVSLCSQCVTSTEPHSGLVTDRILFCFSVCSRCDAPAWLKPSMTEVLRPYLWGCAMAQRLGAQQLEAQAGQQLLAEERLQAGRKLQAEGKLQQAPASPHAA